jgi:thioredoxin 1
MEQTMKDFAARYTDVVFIRIDVDELQVTTLLSFHS